MTERPSYILFITDQQRYDHLGCNGHPVLRTPNIDAMAAEGVSHDRFYVASPVCMPNRASLMTCRMPSSHGTRSLGIPLSHDNVTFVELLSAAGYDTCLIGKSHLQNVSDWDIQIEPPEHREDFAAPPDDLAIAVRCDLDNETYQYERQEFWDKPDPKVPLPFYGFNEYTSVMRHGFNTGGDHLEWVKKNAPDALAKRGRNIQLAHDYTVPQAIRTKVPEEHYSTSFIADRAAEWLEARKDNPKPFLLVVSFPDPHHPFTPPGKYWDMYKPEDMVVPAAYVGDDWDPPEYVKIAERDRANDPSLGQMAGYSLAVSKQEAQEARALTCGMITMIDDAVGRVRNAAFESGVADNTVQIYTSDHGDHLGEHRLLFKGAEQYDSLTHVPFIWADPKADSGTRTDDLAQTHDIGTTILEHAKVERSLGMQGVVLPVVGGAGRNAAHIQYETQRTQEAFGPRPRVHSIVQGNWRLSIYLGKCQNELFDLANDPGEMVNLWDNAENQDVKARLLEGLAELEIAAADRVPLPTAQA
ncbi:sulfatase-like hydrolase/transferase [Planktotalea sp.]|uniref:sulfatase family protein n=1 Tax=Planktotalea sp. TaxID=2029877 RepID=UPI0025D6B9BA|nr:sulfatase-like hydrolase/transferase [Planktotalea sp.]